MIQQSIKKELILVFSDLHSVAVLLLMPIVFMVIMTFALSEKQSQIINTTHIQLLEPAQDKAQNLYLHYLSEIGYQIDQKPAQTTASIHFLKPFNQSLFSQNQQAHLQVDFSEHTSPQIKNLILQHLQLAFAKLKLHLYLTDTGDLTEDMTLAEQSQLVNKQTATAHLIKQGAAQTTQPVTLYSIPAWLIFGVYFIVLPISTTLLNEHNNGTLVRLKTFPINLNSYFAIKLFSFYCISLCQFFILALIGFQLIPRLIGLDAIAMSHLVALLPSAAIICFAAISFAAIIANWVKSYEQAIVLGGGINIILAALSGFMVPYEIMPASLQKIAQLSPMFWSAATVRDGMLGAAAFSHSQWLNIAIFGCLCCGIAFTLFNRNIRNSSWN